MFGKIQIATYHFIGSNKTFTTTNLPYFYQKVIFDFCLGLLGLYNNEMNSSPILGKGERTYVSVHKVECDKIEDRCSQTNIGNRG